MKISILSIVLGFIILFGLYHAAEYMIVFKNHATGFLAFQIVFFIAAWVIARWQFGAGLSAWGLDAKASLIKHLLLGITMGIALYGATFWLSNISGAESMANVPSFASIAGPLSLFVFGNFFSSFSEDILTRGYVYKHLNGRISNILIILISTLIYVLNHIYRYNDAFETHVYLFALGLTYVIPLVLTKRLWFTGGMHWAGNCFFYATHELITTNSNTHAALSPNYLLAILAVVFIPLNYLLLKALKMVPAKKA